MGVDIFDRVATGVRLSSAGEHLMGLIDNHLNAFDDFQALVDEMQEGPAGSLTVSLASELTTGLIPEAIAGFQAIAPRVTLEIVVADDVSKLMAHDADLAIVTGPAASDSRAEVLVSHQTGLVARGLGPMIHRASDLQEFQLVLPPEGTGSRSVADHLLRKNRLSPAGQAGFAGIWPIFADGPVPQLQLLPAAALPQGLPGQVSQSLSDIQISILRREGVALTRSAQLFLTRIEAMLDHAETRARAGGSV